MQLQVILTHPVRTLGKIGDVVKVRAGYARNYLIPKNWAIRATEQNKLLIDQQKHSLEEKNHKLYENAQQIAEVLNNQNLIFVRQAVEDGRLFGSVTNKDILKSLETVMENANISIDYDMSNAQVILPHPLKSIGFFPITVALHPEIIVNINISIGRTPIEANDFLQTASAPPPAPEDEQVKFI